MCNDPFEFFPDMDGDGDHDVVDFLIMDDMLREEEEENEGGLFDDGFDSDDD